MTTTTLRVLFPVLCLTLSAAALGCGDDDKDDDTSTEEGEAALKAECATISAACHGDDSGEGAIHECHELAHENVVGVCAEHLDSCLTTCAGGDGGTHEH